MTQKLRLTTRGPFRAEQIHEGDYYELSNGHPIQCLPGEREHADRNLTGAVVIASDPDVEWAGIDAGYTPEPGTLRAPDVAVGRTGHETGWIQGSPTLAVEYAGQGQNENDLQDKISDLFKAGTQMIWVVRLTGPRRVEVHQPGQPMRLVLPGEALTAPGVLRNPVPVEALYDRTAAHEATLRNLLQRRGYDSVEAIYAKGEVSGEARGEAKGELEGLRNAIRDVIQSRGLPFDAAMDDALSGCSSPDILRAGLAVSCGRRRE